MHWSTITSVLLGFARLGLTQRENVTLIDPIDRFQDMELGFPEDRSFPVLQTAFEVRPDCGEDTYTGTGRLQGLKVLITGGDSGIGRGVVIAYVREGASVAINYLPAEEPDAQDLADLLAGEGLSFERIPGDLNNETFCAELVHEAHRRLGGLDVMVPNAAHAGILAGEDWKPISEQSTEQLEQIYRTNVFANFFLVRAAVPLLPRGGAIIFTCSDIVSNPDPSAVDYGSSKAAVTHMVRGLALQLAARGVRVNGVAPGLTYTPHLASGGYTGEGVAEIASGLPFGRLAQPGELAPLFVSLAEPLGTYTSGSIYSGAGARPGP